MGKGVLFDDIHSYRDLGLILVNVENPFPAQKTYMIDIPGGDGSVDLSNYLTIDTKYENRKLKFVFAYAKGYRYRFTHQSHVANALHGKRMKIILDDDPGFYYIGRVNVNEWSAEKSIGVIDVEVDAEPYKYDRSCEMDRWKWDIFSFENGVVREYRNLTISGSRVLRICGSRMAYVPTFTVDSDMSIEFNGKTYRITKGENKIYDIYIMEGDHLLTVTGNGKISIKYKGGCL